ncbi:recombinase family protein [Rhizobium ruizarguesonis]
MNYPPENARVACYFRVGFPDPARIEDQRRKAKAFCDYRGWKIVQEHVDDGASGMTEHRDAFQAMLKMATSPDHPVDVILVTSLDRFSRNIEHVVGYAISLRGSKVMLLSTEGAQNVHLTADIQKGTNQVVVEFAALDHSLDIRRSLTRTAEEGFWTGSLPPLGYKSVSVIAPHRVRRKLEIHPSEAKTVRLIFKLYLGSNEKKGMSIANTVRYLNSHRFRRRGDRFTVQTVRTVLLNRVYIGEYVFRSRRAETGGAIVVAVPPIIDRAIFDAVQEVHGRRISSRS